MDGRYALLMSNGSTRILLVDDEESIQTLLSYPLRRDGYQVTPALDGREALKRFGESRFDLAILDVMLPKLDGVEVCRRMRRSSRLPIIMLTAKDSETDKVAGLEVGADDYITKPFSMREFRSRVKAALRRSQMTAAAPEDEPLALGDLGIDPGRRLVTLRGDEVAVTHVEFEILWSLARSPGRVLGRKTLLERVWGGSEYRDPRTVDVHIRHLREKLEGNPKEPEFIFTVRGVGYRFRE
jgi:DNA-binding response OmpR family regulator